jgi:hypothetical protein
LFDSGCKSVKVEVVLKDVGVGKNGAEVDVVQEYSFARPRTKLRRRYF